MMVWYTDRPRTRSKILSTIIRILLLAMNRTGYRKRLGMGIKRFTGKTIAILAHLHWHFALVHVAVLSTLAVSEFLFQVL